MWSGLRGYPIGVQMLIEYRGPMSLREAAKNRSGFEKDFDLVAKSWATRRRPGVPIDIRGDALVVQIVDGEGAARLSQDELSVVAEVRAGGLKEITRLLLWFSDAVPMEPLPHVKPASTSYADAIHELKRHNAAYALVKHMWGDISHTTSLVVDLVGDALVVETHFAAVAHWLRMHEGDMVREVRRLGLFEVRMLLVRWEDILAHPLTVVYRRGRGPGCTWEKPVVQTLSDLMKQPWYHDDIAKSVRLACEDGGSYNAFLANGDALLISTVAGREEQWLPDWARP